MTEPMSPLGDGPRPIDGERALRLTLALLEQNEEAFFETLTAMLEDEDDRPALAATLSTLFVLASDMAGAASKGLGVDEARRVVRDKLTDSLRGAHDHHAA